MNRPLTRNEVAAMWLFADTYSAQKLGAIEFWKALSKSNKDLIREMVAAIVKAKP